MASRCVCTSALSRRSQRYMVQGTHPPPPRSEVTTSGSYLCFPLLHMQAELPIANISLSWFGASALLPLRSSIAAYLALYLPRVVILGLNTTAAHSPLVTFSVLVVTSGLDFSTLASLRAAFISGAANGTMLHTWATQVRLVHFTFAIKICTYRILLTAFRAAHRYWRRRCFHQFCICRECY